MGGGYLHISEFIGYFTHVEVQKVEFEKQKSIKAISKDKVK